MLNLSIYVFIRSKNWTRYCATVKTWNCIFMIFHRIMRVSNFSSCKLVRNYFCEHDHILGVHVGYENTLPTMQHWHFFYYQISTYFKEKNMFLCVSAQDLFLIHEGVTRGKMTAFAPAWCRPRRPRPANHLIENI